MLPDDQQNPWRVNSIRDFSFFCCPECDYKAKAEDTFEQHAVNLHPLSSEFFTTELRIKQEDSFIQELDPISVIPDDMEFKNSDDEEYFEPDNEEDENMGEGEEDDVNSYKCSECKQDIRGLINLGMHLHQAHDKISRQWKCPSCETNFSTSTKMRLHIEAVHLGFKVKCPLCEAKMSRSSLRSHLVHIHQGDEVNNSYKCDHCDYASHALKYLKAHVFHRHAKEKHAHQCDECDRTFPFDCFLRQHKERTHGGLKTEPKDTNMELDEFESEQETMKNFKSDDHDEEKTIKCDQCPDEFESMKILRQHKKSDHQEGELVACDLCPKVYNCRNSLRMHKKTAHIKLECDQCSEVLSSRHSLKMHKLSEHAEKQEVACDLCPKVYKFPNSLRMHKKTAHKKLECNQCSEVLESRHNFKMHMMSAHPEVKLQGKSLKCELCPDQEFKLKRHLRSHMKSVHNQHTLGMCDQCGKVLKSQQGLKLHMETAHGGLKAETVRIKCAKCEDTFSGDRYYKQHYRLVHGTTLPSEPNLPKYICDQCSGAYETKCGLKHHIQTVHEGIKPKKQVKEKKLKNCPHCEKAFKSYCTLREHVAVKHEMSTPFKCDQCSKSYGTRAKLKTHVINVHSRVKCDECNQEICNAFMLKRHKATAHNKKPSDVFQCEHCPKFYQIEAALNTHVLNHHS